MQCLCYFQEAEAARRDLLELQAVAAAVESSGQAKAEAQVCVCFNVPSYNLQSGIEDSLTVKRIILLLLYTCSLLLKYKLMFKLINSCFLLWKYKCIITRWYNLVLIIRQCVNKTLAH